MYNYTNLTFTELVNKIGSSRYWNLPAMLKEVLNKINTSLNSLDTRVDAIESEGIESVSGDSVDNTDSQNPIINAIPLSGTQVGNPVTGDIEIDNTTTKRIFATNNSSYIEISLDGTISINDESGGNVVTSGIISKGNSPLEKGLTGTYDYTSAITDLDYVQKIYVDALLPQVADDFLNDAAAAIGGIAVGRLYHTAGAVKVRLV